MQNKTRVADPDMPLYEVSTPTGGVIRLMTEGEQSYYNDLKTRYLSEYRIENVSDLSEIERILVLEVMVQRWSTWITQGFDYEQSYVSAEECRKNIKEYSTEIRQCKESLGIDRVARNKDKGEDTANYLENLRARAREFGIMRDNQAAKAIQLMKQAETLIGTYMRCDEEERQKLRLDKESIFDWFMNIALPEFNEIDDHFRKTNQRMWIRQM